MKSYMKDIYKDNKDIFVSDKIHAKCTMYHESKEFFWKNGLNSKPKHREAQKRFGDLYAGADPGFF